MHNVQHVFFDLDHTLWDFDKNSALTFQKIFKEQQVAVQLNDFLKIYEPINLNYWKLYREERVDQFSLRYGRLKDTFDALDYKIDDELIHLLGLEYIKFLSTFNHLFEGTIEILNYLQKKYQLHIITNGFDEVQHKKLSNANILHFFKTVTNSEMVGVKKPNPLIFNFALESAKAQPDCSLMIGDNYEADILGALNVGLDVILFDYHKFHTDNGIKKVDALIQLKQYL